MTKRAFIKLFKDKKVVYRQEYNNRFDKEEYNEEAYLLSSDAFYKSSHCDEYMLYLPADPEDRYSCDCLVMCLKDNNIYYPITGSCFQNIKRQTKYYSKKKRKKI